jgi:HPr kinase/phosphorylase
MEQKTQNLTGDELIDKIVIHGVFLEVHGLGVLLTGESGVGKSELALELITRGHRLVVDDAPEFSQAGSDTVRGTCPNTLRDFLEVRSLGLMNIRAMYGDNAIKASKDLHLIIHLEKMAGEELQPTNRLEGNSGLKNILDVEIPMVTLPAGSGRNLAVLVEAAARHHILLRKGYNASESFINRQQEALHQQSKYQQNPDKQ